MEPENTALKKTSSKPSFSGSIWFYVNLPRCNDPCFDWKRPSFGGLNPQNRWQTGSTSYTPKSYWTMFLCFIIHLDLPCFFISWFRQSWSLQRVPSRELVPCISGCSQRKKVCPYDKLIRWSNPGWLGYTDIVYPVFFWGDFWWAIPRIPP